MNNPHIRPAIAKDTDAIVDLVRAAYAPWLRHLPDMPDVTDGIDRNVADGEAHVAVIAGRIVGILIAHPHGRAYHIVNVAVHPDLSGRGIARGLMDHAKALARKAGLRSLKLTTHSGMPGNIAMYEHLGWSVTSRGKSKVGMSLDLTD